MQTEILIRRRGVRLAALAGIVVAAAGCGIDKQSAPALSGPSEFSTSLVLTAAPDTLVQDGESQTVITVVARNANGAPIPGLGVQFDASSSSSLIPSVTLTQHTVVTDSAGRATTSLIAPPPPAVMPSTTPVVTVRATPVGGDFASAVARQVQVRLVAPAGTPNANNNPIPSFTILPAVANIGQTVTFDASATTDEGQPCGSKCTYLWDFGDFTTGSGITATKSYTLPQSYTITLTVQDDRGGVASTQRTLTISGPTAPVANFTITPASPTAGTAVTFNASSSTVGTGATITQYAWDFGDGSATVTTAMPAVQKTYGAAGSYLVTLTVTDSLGRTAIRSSTVTIAP